MRFGPNLTIQTQHFLIHPMFTHIQPTGSNRQRESIRGARRWTDVSKVSATAATPTEPTARAHHMSLCRRCIEENGEDPLENGEDHLICSVCRPTRPSSCPMCNHPGTQPGRQKSARYPA